MLCVMIRILRVKIEKWIFRYERLLRTESELRGSSDLYSGEFKYEKNIDNFGYKFFEYANRNRIVYKRIMMDIGM